VDREIGVATDAALSAPMPEAESATRWVYSPDVDPASSAFEAEPMRGLTRTASNKVSRCAPTSRPFLPASTRLRRTSPGAATLT